MDWLYSASDEKVIPGLCFVPVLWISGGKTYVEEAKLWQKEGDRRNELCRNILHRFKQAGFKPSGVFFDAWTLELLDGWDWVYVARIKSNRYLNGAKLNDTTFYGGYSQTGKLRGLSHTVQVVKHNHGYLVTNSKKPQYTKSLATLYKKRWCIEVLFRELKSVLHLEHCAARSLNAQAKHIHACLQAYLILQKHYPTLGAKTTQQQFIQKHDTRKTIPRLTLCYAA